MITARLFQNSDKQYWGFQIEGHAGYAEEGSDIICAAVSAIAYTAVGYFSEKKIGGNKPRYSEKDGYMRFKPDIDSYVESDDKISAFAVMEAACIGFKQIKYSYGKEYIEVIDKTTD